MNESNVAVVHSFTSSSFSPQLQVESGKVVVNEAICTLVDKASCIAAPCIEILAKVTSVTWMRWCC